MKKCLINWVAFAVLAVWSSYPAQADTDGNSAVGHSKAPIFSIEEKIVFNLETDFVDLWKHRTPANAEVPEEIKGFETPGRLTWKDTTGKHDLPVLVQLRGNTSQSEMQCSFPKMTLHFEENRATDERVSKGCSMV